jgi:hypothetical protein
MDSDAFLPRKGTYFGALGRDWSVGAIRARNFFKEPEGTRCPQNGP